MFHYFWRLHYHSNQFHSHEGVARYCCNVATFEQDQKKLEKAETVQMKWHWGKRVVEVWRESFNRRQTEKRPSSGSARRRAHSPFLFLFSSPPPSFLLSHLFYVNEHRRWTRTLARVRSAKKRATARILPKSLVRRVEWSLGRVAYSAYDSEYPRRNLNVTKRWSKVEQSN